MRAIDAKASISTVDVGHSRTCIKYIGIMYNVPKTHLRMQ